MNLFTFLFLSLLAVSLIVRLWLTIRQGHHVSEQRHQVPEAFRLRVTLAAHQKAAAYTLAGLKLERTGIIVGTIIMVLWTVGGGLQLLDEIWSHRNLPSLTHGVALILSLLAITYIIELPLGVWRIFVIERRFGFNRSGIGLFVADRCREIILTALLMTPMIFAILWLIGNQTYWWLYVWLVWSAFSLLMLWLYPVVIAPLFNQFKVLDDPELRQRIEALLHRAGFKTRGIFVVDGSRRSSHGNAYFTGLGRNKRIVFYDTLLRSLNHDEILAVLSHELGHFRHAHIKKRLTMMAVVSLTILSLLAWLSPQTWFYQGLGVSRSDGDMLLALFLVCAPLLADFVQPLTMYLNRRDEYQADAFAASRNFARPLIDALIKLYQDNATTLTPDPLYATFHESHPTAADRISHLEKSTVPV
jgi:STE24 endopeptidase